MIDHSELRKLVKYSKITGLFTWKKARPGVSVGEQCGHVDKDGYVRIRLAGRKYYAQVLAWFYVTGEWPSGQVDHRDRVRTNNKWRNLRDVEPVVNANNRGKFSTNTSGVSGIDRSRGRWRVRITVEGKRVQVGLFRRFAAARSARREALLSVSAGQSFRCPSVQSFSLSARNEVSEGSDV
ncbi:MAG: HNH endonuclease [candidate division WS6 bacterium GW2011_GWD1_35_594]|nr:MAG: HNH endonuclease [candidate division WS6 bacterium GW2011_GWD1_35_594]